MKFHRGTNAADRQRAHAKYGGAVRKKNPALGDVEKVELPRGADWKQVFQKYQKDPLVKWVQPNYLYRALWEPDDPYYQDGSQWYLPRINAPAAWEMARGKPEIIIAVVDSGVDFNHPDLAGNLLSGYNVLAPGNAPADDNGHGTHVAGVAAAVTNNALGVAGVAGSCRLLPVKVLDAEGFGDTFDIAEGICWATDHGARIINLSLGGFAEEDFALREAVQYAYERNVLVVAAAGNDGAEEVSAPAAYPHVVAVGAGNRQDDPAAFSNYGEELDMLAPGEGVLSTYPVAKGSYATSTGTSLAAPQVAAAAALILELHPDYTPAQVETLLEFSARDRQAQGWDKYSGYGLLDAAGALLCPLPPPDAWEPDDRPDASLALELEQTILRTIVPADDADWYHLIIPANFSAGRVTLEIFTPAALDGVVDVFTGPRTVSAGLSKNDLSPVKTIDFWGTGTLDAGSWEVQPGQSFYLKVRDFNTRWSTEPYSLRVTASPQRDAWEPDDTAEQAAAARPLIPGKEIQATFYPDGDEDWYKLDVAQPGFLTATITPPEKVDPVVELYRSRPWSGALQKIAAADSGGRGKTEELRVSLPGAGIYYLRLRDYYLDAGSFSREPYRLKVFYPASAGSVRGFVYLQGRGPETDLAGIKITFTPAGPAGDAPEGAEAITAYTLAGGNFNVENVPPGTYRMKTEQPHYLAAEKTIEVAPGCVEELASPITLRAGDLNGDNKVDISDLVLLAGSYGTQCTDPRYNPFADLNANGAVDLRDLLLLAGNYGSTGAV